MFSPGVFLSSRVTEACPVSTDLIMRFNVRTTTTTICTQLARRGSAKSSILQLECNIILIIYIRRNEKIQFGFRIDHKGFL